MGLEWVHATLSLCVGPFKYLAVSYIISDTDMMVYKIAFSYNIHVCTYVKVRTVYGDCSHEIRRWLPLGRKAMTSLDKWVKKQRHHFANKGLYSQTYGFFSSHVWLWELDHKEVWAPKNWCFWIAVLEKTLETLLDCKEIKPINSKGNQIWIFIGRTDAEAEGSILWPPDVKS